MTETLIVPQDLEDADPSGAGIGRGAMTDDKLRQIIERVRIGGELDFDVELKQSWWDLKHQSSLAEFFKDVAGMANGHGDADEPRHILLGVKPNGAVVDAAVPMDEANIQNKLLNGIDPVPTVSFTTHRVHDATISVLTINPPFDRPYVVQQGERDLVFLRRGTRVGTATRRDLDRFYTSDLVRRKQAIELQDLEARRTPQVRLGGFAHAQGPTTSHGTLKVQNVGEQPFDVLAVTLTLSGPRGTAAPIPLVDANQLPTTVHPPNHVPLTVNLRWEHVASVLADGTSPAKDAWRSATCKIVVTCRSIQGVEVTSEPFDYRFD